MVRAMPAPMPRNPPHPPRSTRAGSRHWQPGGLLKKRLDTSAKAMEYKPQKPDPALAGAQAHRSWSSTPVLATPPRATRRLGSEGHPRPQAAAPMHHRRRLRKPEAGRPTSVVSQNGCLHLQQILKYGYKKSLIRTKEGEVKWAPTKKLHRESFASSACVIL